MAVTPLSLLSRPGSSPGLENQSLYNSPDGKLVPSKKKKEKENLHQAIAKEKFLPHKNWLLLKNFERIEHFYSLFFNNFWDSNIYSKFQNYEWEAWKIMRKINLEKYEKMTLERNWSPGSYGSIVQAFDNCLRIPIFCLSRPSFL